MIGLAKMMMSKCGYVLWNAPPRREHIAEVACSSCMEYFQRVDFCTLRMEADHQRSYPGKLV